MKKTQNQRSASALSDVQRKALITAYAQGFTMVICDDPGFGFKMSTVRSLEKAGLIERDPNERGEDAYRTTPAGREALGIVLEPKPRGLKAALLRAIRVFLPEKYADEVEIEAEPRIRKGSTLTVSIPNPRRIEDMEEEWSAVETLVCEWGWPVEIETFTMNCTVTVEWLDE